MKGKLNFKVGALCAILSAMLLLPALAWGEAKKDMGEKFKEHQEQLIKNLKLAPDKEKAILDLEEKYAKERKDIVTDMKKSNAELAAALKAANPDEAKVKELVSAITAGQDKLFASFKNQRDEELALMTPVEQGKYIVALGKWREEMMAKHKKGSKKTK